MVFKDGDFVEIEYSIWDAFDNSLITTTEEKKAKEANIYTEGSRYGPVLIVIGERMPIKGLAKEVQSLSLNEAKKFRFKPEQAFGERRNDLVRTISLSELNSRGITPYQGMQLDLDGIVAIVKSVNSGRVVVDANHPFAGREIICEVKPVENPTTDKQKIEALCNDYAAKPESMNLNNDGVVLNYSETVEKQHSHGKREVVNAIFKYTKLENVQIIENYKKDKKEEKHTETSQPNAQ